MRLPSALIRQFGESEENGFVLNRGFEKHLMLYPKEVWEKKTKEINQLNIYNSRHRNAIRYFYRGATELNLDSADRVLITKSLMEYAGIEKAVVVFAYGEHIEIWAKGAYEAMIANEPEDFSAIADEIFGDGSKSSDTEMPL